MTSVQSVTCCCLLWLMLSAQFVTAGSPGTAQLSGHRTARVPTTEEFWEDVCPGSCPEANPLEKLCPESCLGRIWGNICCSIKRDVVSSITRRKRSMTL
uniref:Conotoxin n=1 Tax=Conus praecellens TaxID=128530 RepID=A0A291C2D7_CONPC|nr:conotoxin [Conus praecellens]